MAVRAIDGHEFIFYAEAADDFQQTWAGVVDATTPDVAMLDVFLMIRNELGSESRIRFIVDLPRKSPLWMHHDGHRQVLPHYSVQGPSANDAKLMAHTHDRLQIEVDRRTSSLASGPSLPALTLAADGSVRGRFSGYGWLASNGQYGLKGKLHSKKVGGSAPPLVAELRAIDDAVRTLTARPLTIYCDNTHAVSLAHQWMEGQVILPEGYSTKRARGGPAGLVDASHRIHRNRHRLDIRWIRGHQGEPLNEGADALARLASRYLRGDKDLSPDEFYQRARRLAEAFAAEFRHSHASSAQEAISKSLETTLPMGA